VDYIKKLLAICTLPALAVALAVGVSAEEPRPVSASAAAVSAIDIDNFGRVSASYYRGAQPDIDDYADLAALGVKTVIDLQESGLASEPGLVERAGMTYVRIPMTTRKPPTSDQLAQFLGLVNDPATQPVYVHCAGGRHRTGVMTAVFRMTSDGWTPDQAFKEMKHYDFGADFLHPEFKRFVYAYRAQPMLAAPVPGAVAVSVIK
jgi:protein tyrosine/serine phosphatase